MYILFFFSCAAHTPSSKPKPPAKIAAAESGASEDKPETLPSGATVVLDGVSISVRWDDGDTFSGIHPESGKKIKARLNAFNTLESYGPVHRWGAWTAVELHQISKDAGEHARKGTWECTDTGKGGGYGRILVDCPDLRLSMLSEGLAHPFSLKESAPEKDLAALRSAITAKKGMWAKGAPSRLISSLHSQNEKPDKDAYNRICDLSTGICSAVTHQNLYAPCQEVCLADEDTPSCMVYVPYYSRYGDNKPACLLEISTD